MFVGAKLRAEIDCDEAHYHQDIQGYPTRHVIYLSRGLEATLGVKIFS